eukprot:6780498-Prymnesium_polylepis.2
MPIPGGILGTGLVSLEHHALADTSRWTVDLNCRTQPAICAFLASSWPSGRCWTEPNDGQCCSIATCRAGACAYCGPVWSAATVPPTRPAEHSKGKSENRWHRPRALRCCLEVRTATCRGTGPVEVTKPHAIPLTALSAPSRRSRQCVAQRGTTSLAQQDRAPLPSVVVQKESAGRQLDITSGYVQRATTVLCLIILEQAPSNAR